VLRVAAPPNPSDRKARRVQGLGSKVERGREGYLAHKKQPPPPRTLVALCQEPYGGRREVGVSYKRGTPVREVAQSLEREAYTLWEGLHVTRKYRGRSMQHTCSRHAAWDFRRVGWLTRRGSTHSWDLSGRGTTGAEDAQGTPTQSHISPSLLVYEDQRFEPESDTIF